MIINSGVWLKLLYFIGANNIKKIVLDSSFCKQHKKGYLLACQISRKFAQANNPVSKKNHLRYTKRPARLSSGKQ